MNFNGSSTFQNNRTGITCDPPDVAEIDAMRRADAHSELKRWLSGDHCANNQLRHREC